MDDLDLAQLLLQHGADPNKTTKHHNPLHSAVWAGNLPLVEILLEHGADIDADNGSVFSRAASRHKILSRLLDEPMTPLKRREYVRRAMHAAASNQLYDMCVWLLDTHGADVNSFSPSFQTPLGDALSAKVRTSASSSNNHRRLVEMLIARGANVNPVPPQAHRWTPSSSRYYPPSPLARALQLKTYLDHCAKAQCVAMARVLLDAGASAVRQPHEQVGPLQAAAASARSLVAELLERGADVNDVDGGHYGTALIAAANAHDCELVEALLAAGADVTLVPASGEFGTALHAAAGHPSRSRYCQTLERDSIRTMQVLVDAGADVNARGGRYGTALQAAAADANLEAVQWLVARGADVRARGGEHGNVYKAAVHRKAWGVVSWLEQHYGRDGWEVEGGEQR